VAAEAAYVWRPSEEAAAATRVMRFAASHGAADYATLHRRALEDPEWFWAAVVEDLGIEFSRPYARVLDESRGPEWATWFVGGRLNLAWNCAGRWRDRTPHAVAVRSETEDGDVRSLTYAELWRETCRLAAGLRGLGVAPGDRVGLFLPMLWQAVVASHACALIGAVQVPIFSGLAAPAVAARLVDCSAKAVVTVDGTLRRGVEVPMKQALDDALATASSVEHVVVVRRLGDGVRAAMDPRRDVTWDDLVAGQPDDIEPEQVESEHPYYLGYTSGTTGRPKGVVHATAGFLVKIAQEAAHQTDLWPHDTLYWVTDLGWLMGAWEIVGAGSVGATVVLCEGAPNTPPDRVWRQCARHEVSALGISPTLVRSLVPAGDEAVRRHDLSRLRVLGSTGEPWTPDAYRWLFDVVGRGRCPIINISGGTEVGACFLSPTPATPIKECSLGGPSLGMAVDVVDAEGRAVRGQLGELVCRRPWPAMTRGIWRDPERYLDSYWRRFPGIWTHGDWALVDEDGQWFLFGRSDDTLNVAGKRLGPAEVEAVLVAHPDVVEAAAIGMPHDVKGEVPWCFCVLAPDVAATEELALQLRDAVEEQLGKSFAPQRVVFVPGLPKTRSAKIMRRAIRAAATGSDPGDLSGLEDPDVLDAIARAVAVPGAV
jgi:acetyl-CoA synthetase